MFVDWILFVVSIALITRGGSWFVDSAVGIAKATRIPKAIIGGTIVSIGTTMPEFTVSFIGALRGNDQIALGNAVGSSICNIGLIFGLVALLSPMHIRREHFVSQGVIMIACGAVVIVLSLFSRIGAVGGIILLVMLGGYIWYSVRSAARGRNNEVAARGDNENKKTLRLSKEIMIFLIGCAFLIVGSWLLIKSGTNIAEKLGVPQLVIASVMFALGTSLPELVTSMTAIMKGHHDISFGNIMGANILDLAWVLGACAIAKPMEITQASRLFLLPVMFLLMLLMVIFGRTRDRFTRPEGVVILAVYVAFAIVFLTFFGR